VPNEDGTLARIDPSSNKLVAKVRVGADPDDAAVCDGEIWTTSLLGSRLFDVDPSAGAVAARVPVGVGSVGLACGSALWTANYNTGVLLRIDPRRRTVTGRANVGAKPRSIALGGGSVWVANQASGTISRVALR
jgi:virginiamycin B lyase